MIFKKINLCVLLFLSVSSAQAAQEALPQIKLNLPGPAVEFEDITPTVASGIRVFAGTYAAFKCIEVIEYVYLAREANLQKSNPTINHDVINKLKKMCLDKGVKINHVFYSPLYPLVAGMRGRSAVMQTLCGNILFIGSGYGASKNEKDIIPLTEQETQFIIGHECMHALNFDLNKRYLIDAALSTGILLSKSAQKKALLATFGLLKLFGYSKFIRHQEYNADYYASTDPRVIQQGIDFWQTLADKEQYLDIISRIFLTIEHALFSTHPSSQKRADYLKIRLKELQKQKLNVSDQVETVKQQEVALAA